MSFQMLLARLLHKLEATGAVPGVVKNFTSVIYDFEDEFPTDDLGTLWEENPDNGEVVQEIKKKLIDRLITSRREAGQAGYNEKQAKDNKQSKSKAVALGGVFDGQHYLQRKDGTLSPVSEEQYEAFGDYLMKNI